MTNDDELREKIGKPGGGNYFMKALEMKANSQEVSQLNERKTNKEDSEMMMRSLDIMHKQLTEFSVLFVELIKHGVRSGKESEVFR